MATYTIHSHNGTGLYLNVSGNSQVSNNRNVNIYTGTDSKDQKWDIPSFTGTHYIKSNINNAYALNAYRSGTNWNCDILTASPTLATAIQLTIV